MLTQLPPIAFGFQQHTVNSIAILHRNVFQNGIPTALNMLSNIFGNITTKITIKEDFLYDGLIDFEDVYVLRHFLITTISTFAIPLIFSWSVILPIEEQYCGIYYSYTKTRLSSGIYWLSSFLVDYFIGIFTMSIIGILLFLFNIFHINCLIAYIVATGIFSITFLFQAYVTTFFFDTSSMAISVLHIYNLIMFSVIESLRSYVAKRGFDFHVSFFI
uniref:Uncharacterized protein n=1 Tax=Panagrolaimus sp. JU765 TaxID=591449 RepID=A0AC34RDP6_9BILA